PPFQAHETWTYDIAFRPRHRQFATCSGDPENTVKLWDADTGRLVWTLPRQPAPVWHLAFRPDGARLATCDERGTVTVWDVDQERELRFWRTDGRRAADPASS